MSRKFAVGDLVRVVWTIEECRHLIGTETTITGFDPKDGLYELDLPSPRPTRWHKRLWADGFALVLVYDGNEPASWSDCAWKPKGVQV